MKHKDILQAFLAELNAQNDKALPEHACLNQASSLLLSCTSRAESDLIVLGAITLILAYRQQRFAHTNRSQEPIPWEGNPSALEDLIGFQTFPYIFYDKAAMLSSNDIPKDARQIRDPRAHPSTPYVHAEPHYPVPLNQLLNTPHMRYLHQQVHTERDKLKLQILHIGSRVLHGDLPFNANILSKAYPPLAETFQIAARTINARPRTYTNPQSLKALAPEYAAIEAQFNQALNACPDEDTPEKITFRAGVLELKQRVLTDFIRGKKRFNHDNCMDIANSIHGLAKKVGLDTVTLEDIATFDNQVAPYTTCTWFARICAVIVGAVLGMCAGTVSGSIPGAIAGAAAGGIAGSTYSIWGASHPAKKITDDLKTPFHHPKDKKN